MDLTSPGHRAATALAVYRMTLGSHLQADSFEAFARQRLLPALLAQPGRSGDDGSVQLLRRAGGVHGDPIDSDRQFLLLVSETGAPLEQTLQVEDVAVQRLLDVYAPEVVRLGTFRDGDDTSATGARRP